MPKRNKKSEDKARIPRDRRLLMKRRKRINKRLLNSKSPSLKNRLQTELINIEKQLQESRKKTKYYEEVKAINAITKNSKFFFAYAKKYSKVKHGIRPLKNKKGHYIYDSKKMAEMLSTQFSSVFTTNSQHNKWILMI